MLAMEFRRLTGTGAPASVLLYAADPVSPATLMCRLSRLARGVVAAGLLLLGCGPQSATPMPEPPGIDGSLIAPVIPDIVLLSEPHPVTVKGEPGSVTAGSLVRALNLDGIEAAVEVRSLQDGSFQLTLLGSVGDELRFEATAAGRRSLPVDVVLAQIDFQDAFEPSPRHACVELEPGYQLPFDGAGGAQWFVRNSCRDALTLSTPRFRLMAGGPGATTLATTLPLALPPGQSASLELVSTPGAALPEDQVLFIDVSLEGRLIRYPFGLYPAE